MVKDTQGLQTSPFFDFFILVVYILGEFWEQILKIFKKMVRDRHFHQSFRKKEIQFLPSLKKIGLFIGLFVGPPVYLFTKFSKKK